MWEILNGRDLWSGPDRAKAASIFSSSLDFVHPVKISRKENQQIIFKVFDQQSSHT
jgi:hypothetical protein